MQSEKEVKVGLLGRNKNSLLVSVGKYIFS